MAIWSSRSPMCDLPGPWGLIRTHSQFDQEIEMRNSMTIGECSAGLRASGTGTKTQDKRFEGRNSVRCYDDMR